MGARSQAGERAPAALTLNGVRTRTVHPRVAELIEAGDLVLAPDVDPASVGYIEFATPTRPSHPVSGQLSIPACVLTVDVRRVIARHAGEA